MENLLTIVIVILFVAFVAGMLSGIKPSTTSSYILNRKLLSPAERSFYGVLQKEVGTRYLVLTKVRVADILSPRKDIPRKNWQSAFNRISSKHFDFVICDRNEVSVLCVIELNDKSHNSTKRQQRDEFLAAICEQAQLPLVVFSAQKFYKPEEVRDRVLLHCELNPEELASEDSA